MTRIDEPTGEHALFRDLCARFTREHLTPHAFEWEYFPGPERVATALKAVMTGGR